MEVDNIEVKIVEKKEKKPRNYGLEFLFILFGIGTWLNLNGIWIQLPLLIPRLTEGWALSPQLGMASNIANVGPLIIALIRHIIGKSSSYEVPSICVIFGVGIIVPIILSFTWFRQVYLFGRKRSLYLLILGFFLALVNCTSSVTYLPFVNRFEHHYLNRYFVGEALSSLIPAILGLVQGVGQKPECVFASANSTEKTAKHYPPRFSVEIYLYCLSIVMLISFMAFLLLWKTHRKIKKEKSQAEEVINGENPQSALLIVSPDQTVVKGEDNQQEKFTRETIIYLLIILWTSILLIGCIPSINSYSLNPYGAETFHYVIILCQFCYPFVSLFASFFPKLFQISTIGITVSTIVGTLAFIYIFITALMSPCAPYVDYSIGSYIIATMWLFIYLVFYYERIALGNYLNENAGHRGLFWYGLLTQAGAFIGAVFIFTLSSLDVFKERDFCADYQCR